MQTAIKNKIKAVYTQADTKDQGEMEKIFGKAFFTKIGVLDRIKTFDDACEDQGIDPGDVLPYESPSNAREEAANAFVMLDIIAAALREEVILDWTNGNQKKWYPWFNNFKSGSGFSFYVTDYVWTGTFTAGGARLCVDTDAKAKYFGTQFLAIWNKFLNPNN